MDRVLPYILLGSALLIEVSGIFALQPDPFRSVHAIQPVPFRLKLVDSVVLISGAAIWILSGKGLAPSVWWLLLAVGVLGGRLLAVRLRTTQKVLTSLYLAKDDWNELGSRGSRWRYEMKKRFVDAPEYIDDLTLRLVRQHKSFEGFCRHLETGEMPEDLKPYLDRPSWGLGLPTLRTLAHSVLVQQVFKSSGPYSSGRDAVEIYEELRQLRDKRTGFMDRLQYYWTLRNLNMLDRVLGLALGNVAELVALGVVSVIWIVGFVSFRVGPSPDEWLRALASASLLWLAFVGGGTSLLIVSIFNRTGTFALEFPTAGRNYDAVWDQFISLGILAFFVTFLGFGVGMPLLLDPTVIAGNVTVSFAVMSGLSLGFCLVLLVRPPSQYSRLS